jgi:hypothetical protein
LNPYLVDQDFEFAMKKAIFGLMVLLSFGVALGCTKAEYKEPPPIQDLDMQGVPPLDGDEAGNGSNVDDVPGGKDKNP